MEKQEKVNIIFESLLNDTIIPYCELYDDDELAHAAKSADFNLIPESLISSEERIIKVIEWDKLERKKMCRLLTRNIYILDYRDFTKYNFKLSEVRYIAKFYPMAIERFGIDINKAEGKDDLFAILSTGNEYFIDKINKENLKKVRFNFTETFKIIEESDYKREFLEILDMTILKDYHIVKILIETSNVNIDLVNINKLTAMKWLQVLEDRPNLFEYCNINKFKNVDIFYSLELMDIFKDKNLEFLIDCRDYKKELSPLDWEKLIIINPEKYFEDCNIFELNEINWQNILLVHPELIASKP